MKKLSLIIAILSFLFVGYSASATSPTEVTGNLSSSVASGIEGTVLNCSPLTVDHGTVSAYPNCVLSCDAGYTKSGSACVANSSSGGSISGGGGGGGGASASGASLSIGAAGGSVTLAGSGNSPSVKFTAPAGTFGSATTVAISKVYTSSSAYVPPVPTAGLFMVGGVAYQITATSGSANVTNFSKPVTLTFTYADAQIPAGVLEAGLKIYYYDTIAKQWVAIASTVNSATNTITATVNHLTQFAIYGAKAGGTTVVPNNNAALIAQLQATLNSLIAQLKAVVKDMLAQGKYVSPALMAFAPGNSGAQTATTAKITKAWLLGQSGDEVKIIQTVLAKDAAVYPEGSITGTFDAATLAAVKRFQVKYEIAKEGDAGYGYMGPMTRAKMNAM